jgi:hypothetical protein
LLSWPHWQWAGQAMDAPHIFFDFGLIVSDNVDPMKFAYWAYALHLVEVKHVLR